MRNQVRTHSKATQLAAKSQALDSPADRWRTPDWGSIRSQAYSLAWAKVNNDSPATKMSTRKVAKGGDALP
ncbi:MAG: hypothetical protein F4171_03915 [Gammaproteobacteria bacterium]|nr:hypothetical protein [Gammaproteobacteria bacterium]